MTFESTVTITLAEYDELRRGRDMFLDKKEVIALLEASTKREWPRNEFFHHSERVRRFISREPWNKIKDEK